VRILSSFITAGVGNIIIPRSGSSIACGKPFERVIDGRRSRLRAGRIQRTPRRQTPPSIGAAPPDRLGRGAALRTSAWKSRHASDCLPSPCLESANGLAEANALALCRNTGKPSESDCRLISGGGQLAAGAGTGGGSMRSIRVRRYLHRKYGDVSGSFNGRRCVGTAVHLGFVPARDIRAASGPRRSGLPSVLIFRRADIGPFGLGEGLAHGETAGVHHGAWRRGRVTALRPCAAIRIARSRVPQRWVGRCPAGRCGPLRLAGALRRAGEARSERSAGNSWTADRRGQFSFPSRQCRNDE
jgi:hypothetical protein